MIRFSQVNKWYGEYQALADVSAEVEETARELLAHFGIRFNHLFALTNMPVQRFGSTLVSKGQFATYMQLLRSAYRPENLHTVMCRTLISVDWQGQLYDCDFNQMLGMASLLPGSKPARIEDLLTLDVSGQPIATADHCYGCTAGAGSSCGGALDSASAVTIEGTVNGR